VWENQGMHTHFLSATHALAVFLTVAVVGTLWRLSWMHVLAVGMKRNLKHLSGISRAALAQY
jgi:hypothetical protein